MARGPLIILSGPSGAGKSTVIRRLLGDCVRPLRLSVSATTRAKRPSEREGVDYWFWSREQFQDTIERDGFLEWAEVVGNLYGTPLTEVEPYRLLGTGVLLDIDVQGAEQVRGRCPENVSIFLKAPSLAELERRLRARGTESEASIERRLTTARLELERSGDYQHQVINDNLDRAVAEVRRLVEGAFD